MASQAKEKDSLSPTSTSHACFHIMSCTNSEDARNIGGKKPALQQAELRLDEVLLETAVLGLAGPACSCQVGQEGVWMHSGKADRNRQMLAAGGCGWSRTGPELGKGLSSLTLHIREN